MEDSNRKNVREARDAALMAQKNGYMATLTAIRIVREIHVGFCLFGMVVGAFFAYVYADNYAATACWAAYACFAGVLAVANMGKASQIQI